MRTISSFRFAPALTFVVALAGMQLAWTGCVADGGGGGGVVYGGDTTYIDGGVWADGGGRGWYGRNQGAAYVHPAASRSAPAHAEAPRSSGGESHDSGGHSGGSDDHRK
jgi:hypothetical protein